MPSFSVNLRRWAHLAALVTLPSLLLLSSCDDDPVQLPAPQPIDSPEKLVETLARAYEQRDPTLFASLLAQEAGPGADFTFLLAEPTPLNETEWGSAEEIRIHQRMFQPDAIPPEDSPVPPELWIHNLRVILTQGTAYTERMDLYTSAGGSLDPARWRAMEAVYSTYLLLELAGATDYRVEGGARFVVLEDLEKNVGDPGKFMLLTWEDFRFLPAGVAEGSSWSRIKQLYR